MPTITVQVRLWGKTEEEAREAIAELRAQLGTTGLTLGQPSAGRAQRGNQPPPWFVYGSYTFEPYRTPEERQRQAAADERREARKVASATASAEINRPELKRGAIVQIIGHGEGPHVGIVTNRSRRSVLQCRVVYPGRWSGFFLAQHLVFLHATSAETGVGQLKALERFFDAHPELRPLPEAPAPQPPM